MPDNYGRQKYQKNATVRLKIGSVSNLGYGVGRCDDGMVIFVPGTAPGDVVDTAIVKVTKSYCVGRMLAVVTPSTEREPADFCDAPATCGGCAYRFVKYSSELKMKKQNVRSEFDKAGLRDVNVLDVGYVTDEVSGEPVTRAYRNKAQYRFVQSPTGVRAGFYASGTHRVIGGENCSLQPSVFGQIAREVCEYADKNGISVYDETTGQGLLRHLYLRRGETEIGVCLVVNGDALPDEDDFCTRLSSLHPSVAGIVLNTNTDATNVITGARYRTLFGRGYIRDIFCGLKVEISPAAFYQVNRDAAQQLCRIAGDMAELGHGGHLLDLYCGIGTVGLSMAQRVSKLTGIEIVPEAVECARRNAAVNGIVNASFICADSASGASELLAQAGGTPDTVVLDPPRRGCDPGLLDALAKAGIPRVVYISCNPATLARDVAILSARGYTAGDVKPFDLFPRTGHVETVVMMAKGKA